LEVLEKKGADWCFLLLIFKPTNHAQGDVYLRETLWDENKLTF
jgi:hypothetical protein